MANIPFIYNWYKRYRVLAADMTGFQNELRDYPAGMMEGMLHGSVLSGLLPATGGAMTLSVSPGLALGPTGYLHNVPAISSVTLTAPTGSLFTRNLIVARPLLTDTNPMVNPTNPVQTVHLKTTLGSQVVLVPGTAAASPDYPATQANDVVLFGLRGYPGQTVAAMEDMDFSIRDAIGKNSAYLQNLAQFDDRIRPYKVSNQVLGIKPAQLAPALGSQRQFKAAQNNRGSIFPKTPAGNFNTNDSFLNFQTGAITGGDGASTAFTPTIPAAGTYIVATAILTGGSTLSVSYGTPGTRAQCYNGIRDQLASGPGAVAIPTTGQPVAFALLASSTGATITEMDFFDARGILQGGGGGAGDPTFINYFLNPAFEETADGALPAGWVQYAESESITFTDAGDLVTVPSLLPNAGDTVSFLTIVSTTGAVINTLYYVINPSGLAFQISLTLGGAAVVLTTNGTGTMVRGKPKTGSGGSAVSTVTMLGSSVAPIRGSVSAVITKDAANRMGVGYAYPFTIANSDKGITAGVTWEMLTSLNFVQADMLFYVYDVTNSAIIVPRNITIPKADNFGKFASDYGLTTGTSYRFILHISTPNVLAYTLKLDTMVNSTTRTAVPGPVIGPWQTYIPNLSAGISSTPAGSIIGRWRRVGQNAEIIIGFQHTTGSNGSGSVIVEFGLPIELQGKVDSSIITVHDPRFSVGHAEYRSTDTTFSNLNQVCVAFSGNGLEISKGGTNLFFVGSDILNSSKVSIVASVPIVDWAGQVANFGPGAQTEYGSNSGIITTANGNNPVSTSISGVNGSPILAIDSITGGNGSTTFDVQWSSTIQPNDLIQVEILALPNGQWIDAAMVFPVNSQGASTYGMTAYPLSSTVTRVYFGNKGYTGNNVGYAGNGAGWGSLTGYRWRVRKVNASSPVGFGKANSSEFGLVAPRKGQTALTVTSTVAGWSTARAVGVYYQDQDGNHRLKFNISGLVTSGTYTGGTWTVAGVTFKSVTDFYQAISCFASAASITGQPIAYVNTGASTIVVAHASAASTTRYCLSGDVELDSKPTWA